MMSVALCFAPTCVAAVIDAWHVRRARIKYQSCIKKIHELDTVVIDDDEYHVLLKSSRCLVLQSKCCNIIRVWPCDSSEAFPFELIIARENGWTIRLCWANNIKCFSPSVPKVNVSVLMVIDALVKVSQCTMAQ